MLGKLKLLVKISNNFHFDNLSKKKSVTPEKMHFNYNDILKNFIKDTKWCEVCWGEVVLNLLI